MKNNKTEIVLVVDRSGSMEDIRKDVEGGLNTLLEKQKTLPGDCRLTYVRFDTEIETVLENVELKAAGKITIEPRGGTALLDALGQTINKVGQRLADTPESERPEQVLLYVISDGEENSSHEFEKEKIKEMIDLQTNTYSWKVTFLGCAGFDAVAEGAAYGVKLGNTMNFNTTTDGIAAAFCAVDNATSFYRSARNLSQSYVFTEEERAAAEDKK